MVPVVVLAWRQPEAAGLSGGASPGELRVHAGAALGRLLLAKRTSFLRFWTVAASRNSSEAPLGPRSLSRRRPKWVFRWANSISTFFRCCADCWNASVPISARTCSRSASNRCLVTMRLLPVVQFGLTARPPQSLVLAQ